ncbi:DUF2336 domain-containing protein [Pannonibacter phragmitetus]|uniref:DUF2336 domain-containing protein n=1 Tax=Pannonibacter phragmitetus TaxID=121719 RepID=UPI000F02F8D2|nr:DUF2336 domain-containing protein [Pannonibacter phragmitetus]
MAEELISLAMNPSADARSELMQKLADILLLRADQNSVEELQLFDQVIQRLLDDSPLDDRVRLAEKIGSFAGTPTGLAVRLAQDELQVARPVLEHSPALGPQELAALAEDLGEDHLECMTRRGDLPADVSDTLVRRGQVRVWRRLAGNRRIRLSEGALASLAKAAQDDAALREEMTLRADLTPRICRSLIPFVGKETQERLKELAAGKLTAEDLEGIARRRKIRRKLGTLLDTSNTGRLWRAITLGSALLDDVILLMLEDDRLTNAADLIALACNTHKAHVRSAVFSVEGDRLLHFARLAGLSVSSFAHLVRARSKHMHIQSDHAEALIERFASETPSELERKRARSDFAAHRPRRPPSETPSS